jgi:hypothetical protein
MAQPKPIKVSSCLQLRLTDLSPLMASPDVQHENGSSQSAVMMAELRQLEYGQLLHCESFFAIRVTACDGRAVFGSVFCGSASGERRLCCNTGVNSSRFSEILSRLTDTWSTRDASDMLVEMLQEGEADAEKKSAYAHQCCLVHMLIRKLNRSSRRRDCRCDRPGFGLINAGS